MSVKHVHPDVAGAPIVRGKGLDSLEGFIIQNWAPPVRFGVWSKHVGALSAPRMSLVRFLDEALHFAWMIDGCGAVITIDPPQDPFVAILVESENKSWTPESKYNPKHWLWKVVPVESVIGNLAEALTSSLPDAEASYLRELQKNKLKDAWFAYISNHG